VTAVLKNIEKNGMLNTVEKDEILLKVIKVVVQKSPVKDATQFIKQIRGEPSKVSFNFHPLLYFIGKQHVCIRGVPCGGLKSILSDLMKFLLRSRR